MAELDSHSKARLSDRRLCCPSLAARELCSLPTQFLQQTKGVLLGVLPLRHWLWLLPLACRIEMGGVKRGRAITSLEVEQEWLSEACCKLTAGQPLEAPGTGRQALADLRCNRKDVWLSRGFWRDSRRDWQRWAWRGQNGPGKRYLSSLDPGPRLGAERPVS